MSPAWTARPQRKSCASASARRRRGRSSQRARSARSARKMLKSAQTRPRPPNRRNRRPDAMTILVTEYLHVADRAAELGVHLSDDVEIMPDNFASAASREDFVVRAEGAR